MSDPLLSYLVETQKEQTATLHRMAEAIARLETKIEGRQIADHDRDESLNRMGRRISALEHDRTRVSTALKVSYAALSTIAAVIAWLISR